MIEFDDTEEKELKDETSWGKVFIIGAGPGDPELITVKGQRLLREADVIIYAGSLVNPKILYGAKDGAKIYNSATMTLNEVLDVMIEAVKLGKMVVRLHTGDPAIYGAIQEQMDALKKSKIDYEVVPGVSSFLAAAAVLKQEYTLPNVSQTIIITRGEGRTPVPERESLKSLAAHQATMCIFLSVQMIEEVVRELLAGGYEETTPIAIVHKATWEDQKIIRGTLKDVAQKVLDANIPRQAMIVVGDCLNAEYEFSRLYAPEFSHMFRTGTAAGTVEQN